MIKRSALFALANIVNADGSVELIDQTITQYCVFNDFEGEGKETQDIEIGFEGLKGPGGKFRALTQRNQNYCGNTVLTDME